jgi:hypothetical protein
MPSLPEWVVLRIASLKDAMQRDETTGNWRVMPALPASLILKAGEREQVVRHIQQLRALCAATPMSDINIEQEMLVVLAEMMLVLPQAMQNELSVQAKGAAFLDALEDVTVWAVRAAIRRWNKGACGTDERGRPYDSQWCPAPAALRRIALFELYHISGRADQLERLLNAQQLIDYDEKHCSAMRERFVGLGKILRTPPVGLDGSGEVVSGR